MVTANGWVVVCPAVIRIVEVFEFELDLADCRYRSRSFDREVLDMVASMKLPDGSEEKYEETLEGDK